jgi:hypothetical protein
MISAQLLEKEQSIPVLEAAKLSRFLICCQAYLLSRRTDDESSGCICF